METVIVYVDVQDLRPGMLLAENIYDLEGNILLASGIKLRETYIKKIEETPAIRIAVHGNEATAVVSNVVQNKPQGSVVERKQQRIERTRHDARASMKQAIDELIAQDFGNATIIFDIVERIINDILNSDDIVFHIDQLRDLDVYLLDHSINVTILSIVMGVVSGMNRSQLKILATGAILHDVGKLFLDQDLINRPGPLTPQEFQLVKHHSRLGYELLKKFPEFSDESALIALNHHEKFDGTGYPNGLKGDAIDLYSQIVGLIDVFDALTSDKVYAKKVSPYKAMQIIFKNANTHYDQGLLMRFLTSVGYYYHGAVVRLHNEAIGVVIERDRYRPIVRVIQDANGKTVTDHYEIDLKKNPTIRVKGILTEAEWMQLPYYANKRMGIS